LSGDDVKTKNPYEQNADIDEELKKIGGSFRKSKRKPVQFKCGRLLANYRDLCLQLRAERHIIQHMHMRLPPLSHPECDSMPLRFS